VVEKLKHSEQVMNRLLKFGPIYLLESNSTLAVTTVFNKCHARKMYGGVEIQLHAFLATELDGGKWTASRPGRFTLGERASGTHCVGGWAGPRPRLDAVASRKNPNPCGKSNPDRPGVPL
jgi:hypothetical protein